MTARLLRGMRGVQSTRGRMTGLGEMEVRCSGGEILSADLVVCATGFRILVPPIYIEEEGDGDVDGDGGESEAAGTAAAAAGTAAAATAATAATATATAATAAATAATAQCSRRRCDIEAEQPLLYRSMVLPTTPHIAAILYNSMGINAMFSSELMATWLTHFYASGRADSFRGGEEVATDAAPLRELGGGEAFNTWHFDRSGETAGGRGYAADFYEEQIFDDLGMRLPSRDLALTRSQHDEAYYAAAATSFRALAERREEGVV